MPESNQDREAMRVWEWVLQLHRTATNEMDAHLRARFGRSLVDYDVLHQIQLRDGPVRMGDLADQLLVANSSCNRVVGRLVDDGLLDRRRHPDDHRVIRITMTAAGKRLHRRMAAVHTRDIHRLVSPALGELLEAPHA